MPGSLTAPRSTSLRAWQGHALEQLARWQDGPFLISAAPGAGKTRPALELARALLSRRAVRRVVVLCPTTPLTRQWAAAAAGLGVQLQPDARDANPSRDFDGVAITYARVSSDPGGWSAKVAPDTLVIVDEAHHLGEDLAWGESFQRAFAAVPRWLLLSGTPFRSDATPIPGVRYDREGLVVPDVSYTYAEAVADGVCRPVAFVTFDGTLSWRSGEDVVESSFETVLSAREAARRYRTAISAELPEGLARIVREADAKLRAVRTAGHATPPGWPSLPTPATRVSWPSCSTR
jgi:superfamily II DNA or RNA helicase